MSASTEQSAAIESVASASIEGNAVMDMSVWGMFMQADLVVKAVMVSLLLASVWSWVLMFEKLMRFGDLKLKSGKFEKTFWSTESLDGLYETIKRKANHPMAVIFSAGMEEWFRSGRTGRMQSRATLAPSGIERMAKVMSVARNRELERMERGLGFLATVGSAAPFVGLFGTVWGIMNSFQSIAFSNNTSLAVVAPGIAEALLATAIGLFAAIPAVVAYNKFSGELAKFAGRLEDFEVEFHTLLSRKLDDGAR